MHPAFEGVYPVHVSSPLQRASEKVTIFFRKSAHFRKSIYFKKILGHFYAKKVLCPGPHLLLSRISNFSFIG